MKNYKDTNELRNADINLISKILPHAYPFILIDKIIEMNKDIYGIGVKNVTINEPFFQGHFPNNPIMPGVLQIEGMAQTAAVMCVLSRNQEQPLSKIFFMTIDKAKFRRPVIPGDILYYHLKKIRQRANVWKFKGEAYVLGKLVAEAEISAMIDEESSL
jgi:3-hydroxyacyl-[acyl-carrier-protein] dehydratase